MLLQTFRKKHPSAFCSGEIMISGLILALSGGAFWAVLGIVTACGKKQNAPIEIVQPFAGIIILIFAGWTVLLEGPFIWDRSSVILLLTTLLVGVCNYFMLNVLQRGMKAGREGVVWAFSQSAMICPFALGILFFGEPAALSRIIGLLLILSALILFSMGRKTDCGRSGGWFGPTIAAFAIAGIAQCFASLPSYFQMQGLTPLRRMLILQGGIILAFLCDNLIRSKKIDFRNRKAWLFAAAFGFSNLIALILFYSGQNLLADAKCASISYPAGQGVSIALVFLYGCLKARPDRLAVCAFFLLLSGLVFLSLQ